MRTRDGRWGTRLRRHRGRDGVGRRSGRPVVRGSRGAGPSRRGHPTPAATSRSPVDQPPGARRLGNGPSAGSGGPRRPPGPPVRLLRSADLPLVPDRRHLRRALDPHRGGHPGRAVREHLRRHGPGTEDDHRSRRPHRRPLHDRSGQPHRRSFRPRDRRRRAHRSLRLHHRPEPRLRRSGSGRACPMAHRRAGAHRQRELAGDRRRGPPRHSPGPERGRGCRGRRVGDVSRSLRRRRGAGEDRAPLRSGVRLGGRRQPIAVGRKGAGAGRRCAVGRRGGRTPVR